jgi:putative tryptophan/tyrosine transport system substrate-binding protein
MRRRKFLPLLGGAAAWPFAARAQQPDRVRRVGVLLSLSADDPQGQARLTAFVQGLQQLGWTDGPVAPGDPHRAGRVHDNS